MLAAFCGICALYQHYHKNLVPKPSQHYLLKPPAPTRNTDFSRCQVLRTAYSVLSLLNILGANPTQQHFLHLQTWLDSTSDTRCTPQAPEPAA